MSRKPAGWRKEPARHSLAARGVKTSFKPTEDMMRFTRKADNFSWHGDRDIEDKERWGPTFGKNRDSDALAISNFDAVSDDMIKRFPNDVRIVHSTHWAVGWTDQLFVRMYNDEGPTAAYTAVQDWNARLKNYPVADEDSFDRLQAEMGEE